MAVPDGWRAILSGHSARIRWIAADHRRLPKTVWSETKRSELLASTLEPQGEQPVIADRPGVLQRSTDHLRHCGEPQFA